MSDHDDKIFVKDHLTDFELLLFARKEIKDLKTEKGILTQEISNLKVEIGQLKSFIQELESKHGRSKEENKEFRAISYNKAILEENKRLREKNKKLRKDNSDLITQLIKARNEHNEKYRR